MDQQGGKLQMVDGLVRSIMDVRSIFPKMTNEEFAKFYSDKYRITYPRVLNIVEVLKAYE
ncbi:hypothetical protein [Paenibacillus sp. Soil724D2]|uniref:hypothetical protein n=1 Tax=Paenibacillus sp. (strain Soil724D2) TaxID=1736392 RepID=UPI000714D2A7|nr:hypothetical protein [Paenibacillus sp. Soil724D2]KRE33274.1 hypothetical protein ASG85_13415 [Paenibacillus sp. Soil724D2]